MLHSGFQTNYERNPKKSFKRLGILPKNFFNIYQFDFFVKVFSKYCVFKKGAICVAKSAETESSVGKLNPFLGVELAGNIWISPPKWYISKYEYEFHLGSEKYVSTTYVLWGASLQLIEQCWNTWNLLTFSISIYV